MEKNTSTNPITLTSFLISSQREHKEATGDFTMLLTSIQTACKYISSKVRKAGLANLYGYSNTTNETGDDQKKLDVLSNEVFVNVLKKSTKCCVIASEEEKEAEIQVIRQALIEGEESGISDRSIDQIVADEKEKRRVKA